MNIPVMCFQMSFDGSFILVQLGQGGSSPLLRLHNSPAVEVNSQSQVEVDINEGEQFLDFVVWYFGVYTKKLQPNNICETCMKLKLLMFLHHQFPIWLEQYAVRGMLPKTFSKKLEINLLHDKDFLNSLDKFVHKVD